MLKTNNSSFIGCIDNYKEATAVLYGAAFDSTCSFRAGTRFGPAAIRSESFGIETYSPYLDRDLTDIKVFDSGDPELPIGDTNASLKIIQKRAETILKDNKMPILIGGEHLVSLAAIKAVYKKYPNLKIVHFDAHIDFRDNYLGVKLSHSAIIRRATELIGDGKVYQFGIRSGDREEFIAAKEHGIVTQKFNFEGIEKLSEILGNNPVYFTVDLDVLDSSVFPGTGTPEAGGVTFNELLNATKEVSKLNVVAADIVELSPQLDASGTSTAAACKYLRELLLNIVK